MIPFLVLAREEKQVNMLYPFILFQKYNAYCRKMLLVL